MAYQGKPYGNGGNTGKNEYVVQRFGGGRPPGPPQQQKPPRKKVRWGRLILVVFLFVFVMGLTGLAGYGWYLEKKVVEPSADRPPIPKGEPVNVLLIGMDRDPNSGEAQRRANMNTDTLLMARIDPASSKVSVLSIPRDTRVQLPTGYEKINAAYSIGGMDRLKQTVQELTGLTADRYVMIDFPAFVQVIDAMGGLDFEVDKPISNPEGTVALNAGKQHLNGLQALAVVRFRSEEMGDIARVQRQQRFVEALGTTIKGSNVVDWMNGLRAMSDSLQTDMSINEMGTLALSMQGENVTYTTHTVPGEFLNLYAVSYWKPDLAQLKNIVQEMKK